MTYHTTGKEMLVSECILMYNYKLNRRTGGPKDRQAAYLPEEVGQSY